MFRAGRDIISISTIGCRGGDNWTCCLTIIAHIKELNSLLLALQYQYSLLHSEVACCQYTTPIRGMPCEPNWMGGSLPRGTDD